MSKKPEITPEQIEAGVQKNANEYKARVEALRALHSDHAYNPPMSADALSRAAVEATRGAAQRPAMVLHGNNEGSVRLSARDATAETEAKSKGGRRATKEAQDESGEGEEGPQGNGGVQAREASQRFQERPPGTFPQAGNSHSAIGVGPRVEEYPAKDKEDAEAQLATMSGPGVISAVVRVRYSVVVVRE